MAKTYKGTITIEVGEDYSVDVGFAYSTVSGYWSKSNSTFGFRSQGQRSCTIYGINAGTGTLTWKGVVNADDFEYYWDVVVKAPYTPSEGELFDYNGITYSIIDGKNKTCRVGKYWESENEDGNRTLHYIPAINKSTTGSVTIPSTVTYDTYSGRVEGIKVVDIAKWAFLDCTLITEVVLPNTITSIGVSAFLRCESLTSVSLPSGLKEINNVAFGYTGLKSIMIPSSVTYIGDNVFDNCKSLTSVSVPDGIRHIGSYAFKDTPWLESQSDGLLYIGKVAHLYKGSIPDNTVIKFRDGTISISRKAFYDSSNRDGLTGIEIPESVIDIGENPFAGCRNISTIDVSPNNSVYSSPNNCNAIINSQTQTLISGCKNTTIPDAIRTIGKEAFRSVGITSIILSNIETIEESAFANSSLKEITFGENLKSIESWAFSSCSQIETIHCKSKHPIEIPYAFDSYNYSKATLYVPTGTKEVYQATAGWKEFKNIVETNETQNVNGDVNGDGETNGTDLVAMTNMILGKTEKKTSADLNGDGEVNGTDYVMLVNIVLGK